MRAKDFAIELDDVAITHLSFSREYTAAVEAKQVAQQDSERAKYVVMKAVQEKASALAMLHAMLHVVQCISLQCSTVHVCTEQSSCTL
jgi:regulator of protease activity HflC (stomatin/prohibitin superfamily)